MRWNAEECWRRLRIAEHGVLATVHADRGVDAVPVVYAVTGDGRIALPVDTVKPKSTTQLQRLANLEHDPRCTLLVDEYHRDWSRLWWVRVNGTAEVVDGVDTALHRFAPYRADGAVEATILLTPTDVTGWSSR